MVQLDKSNPAREKTMRICTSLKNKAANVYIYISNFTLGKTAAGLSSGAATGFYIGGILYPFIDWIAFFVGIGAGTTVGIATIRQ